MSVLCKVSRPHAADDRVSCQKLFLYVWFFCRNLISCYAPVLWRLLHEQPDGIVWRIYILILHTILCNLSRRNGIVPGKPGNHHWHAGRPTAADCNRACSICRIAPSFVPLEKMWDLSFFYASHCVCGRNIFFRRVICYKVYCLGILWKQTDNLFRISSLLRLLFYTRKQLFWRFWRLSCVTASFGCSRTLFSLCCFYPFCLLSVFYCRCLLRTPF